MQIIPQSSEDQQIIVVREEIKSPHPALKRPKTCLLVATVFTILLVSGYILLTWKASHLSEEEATDKKKIQIKNITHQTTSNIQNTSVSSSFYDFKAQLSQLEQLIQKIQKSATVHLCLLPQKLFHYYQSNTKVMYFQTAYEVILPSCQNLNHYPWSIDRENIHSWNNNRQVIEWALRYVSPKDHILYYRPNNYNILQITILSKIVGQQGSITIINSNEISACMRSVTIFHGLGTGIRYSSLEYIQSVHKYNVLISSDSSKDFNNKIASSTKSLIYTQNPKTLKKQQGTTIKKVSLPVQPCSELQLSDQLSGQGFYSLLKNGENQSHKPLIKSIPLGNSIRAIVQTDYNKFKQKYKSSLISKQQFLIDLSTQKRCYDIYLSRREEDFIYSIYGHKIYNVSEQELQGWQKQRHVVEWVRSHLSNQTEGNVYYEIQSKCNLLAILEIALMLKTHILTVVCSSDECDRINQQIISNKLSNIELIEQSDLKKVLSSTIIVTDNLSLINKCLENNFLLSGSLLGLFNYKEASSLAFIRKLYVKYNLREVAIADNIRQCIGFQYRHFFWRSWQPQGYYDITLSKDVIYAFWGGHPSKLNIRKKLLVEEVISNSLQTKILSAQTFLPFQITNQPIHPAFHLLTSIQKSDYMRVYLMHHYGGGYTDVKHLHADFMPYLELFKQQQDKLALGYAEIHDFDVPCFEEGTPTCREIKKQYSRIIGNGVYFFKKQTVITTEWFNRMTAILDRKLDDLRRNPPQVPRERFGYSYILPNGTKFTSKYPFRWAEIANQHLVRVQYRYLDNVSTALPYLINVDYRTNDNLKQN